MLVPFVVLQSWLVVTVASWRRSTRADRLVGDAGQTTAEYALVLIGAGAVAVLLITWATKSDLIGRLFGWVLDQIMDRAG